MGVLTILHYKVQSTLFSIVTQFTMSTHNKSHGEYNNLCEEILSDNSDEVTLANLRANIKDVQKTIDAYLASDSLFIIACKAIKPQTAKFLLSLNTKVARICSEDGNYPLHYAAGMGDVSLLKTVYELYPLALHSKTVWHERTPLFMAVQSTSNPDAADPVGCVKYLLSKGAQNTANIALYVSEMTKPPKAEEKDFTSKDLKTIAKLLPSLF